MFNKWVVIALAAFMFTVGAYAFDVITIWSAPHMQLKLVACAGTAGFLLFLYSAHRYSKE